MNSYPSPTIMNLDISLIWGNTLWIVHTLYNATTNIFSVFKSFVPFTAPIVQIPAYWNFNNLLYNFVYGFKIKVNLQGLIMAIRLHTSRGCHSHSILCSTQHRVQNDTPGVAQRGCSGPTNSTYVHFAKFSNSLTFYNIFKIVIHLEFML